MTDGVDAPAEMEADAAVAAPGQHLVPVHAPRGYQVRRSLLAALAIAVLISVIVIERHTLAESLQVLTNLNVGWFVLAVAAETISLTSFGLSRTILVHVNGRQIGFGSVMMITYAANALSISVPFAGAELAGAAVGSTGITPGGFALVELALTAALTATGLHRSPALAAVLAYRLVNFWLVLVAGWILMAILTHRRAGPGGSSPAPAV